MLRALTHVNMKYAATLLRLQVKTGMEMTGIAASLPKMKLLFVIMTALEQNQASVCQTGQSSARDCNSFGELIQSQARTDLIQTI